MSTFTFPKNIHVLATPQTAGRCFAYACEEAVRLFGRLGVGCDRTATDVPGGYRLQFAIDAAMPPVAPALPDDLLWDGYVLAVSAEGVALASGSAKGILNGVYDLAERLGFVFVLPGEAGEWAPEGGAQPLPFGEWVMQPQFPYRGVFWESLKTLDYSIEEWLRYYAKLRFNALSHEIGDLALAEELGLRLEIGGHGLSRYLPRELFAERPELFRMFQPEDFGGKRMPDSNFCVTNPETKQYIQRGFRKVLDEAKGAYAIHAWADDLPAGGWCLCPSCRALQPTDQALLALRHLGEVLQEEGASMRLPMLAYHDTMFPGEIIVPPAESFLLFAPRERCFAHALDDPSCARNQWYLKALQAWMAAFAGNDDPHTFEYYFDQILFRGMYPFLPETILGDMQVYRAAGIRTHLSLQVAGPAIAPEHNMLLFSQAHWDAALTTEDYLAAWAHRLAPENPEPWQRYLSQRATIFQQAMRVCAYPCEIYMDYRWLPESRHPFGAEMACCYTESAEALEREAEALECAMAEQTDRLRTLADAEVARARFEAAELRTMSLQQQALNAVAQFLATGDDAAREEGIRAFRQAVEALKVSRQRAVEANLPEECWYFRNINGWLSGEFARKAENYEGFMVTRA